MRVVEQVAVLRAVMAVWAVQRRAEMERLVAELDLEVVAAVGKLDQQVQQELEVVAQRLLDKRAIPGQCDSAAMAAMRS